MSKIIGVTVGTPTSPEKMADTLKPVKTVNGRSPDNNGNVELPTKLPNPNALTFTGAASGTYDGSKPLSVEIPAGGGGIDVTGAEVGQIIKVAEVDEDGRPIAWVAVSGIGKWKKIASLTLEEAVNTVAWTTFADGSPLTAKKFAIRYSLASVASGNSRVMVKSSNGWNEILGAFEDKTTRLEVDVRGGYIVAELHGYNLAQTLSGSNNIHKVHSGLPYSGDGVFTEISLGYNVATTLIAVGSTFDVWGYIE